MAGAFKAGPGPAPLALTMGEPAGIGLDITLETWLMRREHQVPPFYLIGDRDALVRRARALFLDCPIVSAHPETAASRFDHALPVVPCGAPVAGLPGKPTGEDAASVIGAIERAVDDVAAGRAASRRFAGARRRRRPICIITRTNPWSNCCADARSWC